MAKPDPNSVYSFQDWQSWEKKKALSIMTFNASILSSPYTGTLSLGIKKSAE